MIKLFKWQEISMTLLSLMEKFLATAEIRSYKTPLLMDLVRLPSLNFCKHCLILHMQRQVFLLKNDKVFYSRRNKHRHPNFIQNSWKGTSNKNLLKFTYVLSGLLTAYIALASSSFTPGCLLIVNTRLIKSADIESHCRGPVMVGLGCCDSKTLFR